MFELEANTFRAVIKNSQLQNKCLAYNLVTHIIQMCVCAFVCTHTAYIQSKIKMVEVGIERY